MYLVHVLHLVLVEVFLHGLLAIFSLVCLPVHVLAIHRGQVFLQLGEQRICHNNNNFIGMTQRQIAALNGCGMTKERGNHCVCVWGGGVIEHCATFTHCYSP